MTRAWELYERGRAYNESLTPNQYDLVETNTEFFTGNQWLRLPNTPAMAGLAKPVFNILKRVASLFIASLTSSATTIRLEPLAYYDIADPDRAGSGAAEVANAMMATLLEKLNFDYRLRDALFDGATAGDYCAHFWFDPAQKPYGGAFGGHRGDIRMELVDGINVMFGNPNDRRAQEQPYILLVGRDLVSSLRREARRHGGRAEDVVPDAEYDRMPGLGGKRELEEDAETGKALYVLLYEKVTRRERLRDENGESVREVTTVRVTKATRTAVIYEDVDTGLSLYPIAWGNWEKQKNQYHGRALVTGMIANQIFINSMFAAAMRHLQLAAFPKTIYNADLIARWDNEIGQAVAVHGLAPGQTIGGVAYSLQPAEMSAQLFALIDKTMAYTKECLGATDVQLGNVRPDNTSAIMVMQTQSEVPLENIRAGLYEWTEAVGEILMDLMGTYYGTRPIVVDRELEEPVAGADGVPLLDPSTGLLRTRRTTRRVVEEFDFSRFKELCLNLRVDVGATTYFSEIAMTQTLDNLRRDGTLDVIDYLERLPDKLLPKKQALLDELRRRAGGELPASAAAPPQKGGYAQGDIPDEARAVLNLPGRLAQTYGSLPTAAKKAALLLGRR